MFKHFWATQFAGDELYPAGLYPNQHQGGDGLPAWTAANRSLDNENVVVWYTLNYHHLPRPEDWPVQPCVYASFHWMPSGFFDCEPGPRRARFSTEGLLQLMAPDPHRPPSALRARGHYSSPLVHIPPASSRRA